MRSLITKRRWIQPFQVPVKFNSTKVIAPPPIFSRPATPLDSWRRLVTGARFGFFLYTLAKAGVAEVLEAGPKTIDQVAAATKLKPDFLFRVIRGSHGFGIFKFKGELNPLEPGKNTIENSDLSVMLIGKHPNSVKHWMLSELSPWAMEACIGFSDQGYGATPLDGKEILKTFADNPQLLAVYNNYMSETSKWSDNIAQYYDFKRFSSIIDLGGSVGGMIPVFLEGHPSLNVSIFDLPATIEAGKKLWSESKQFKKGQLKFISGDFFKEVPGGYDAYFLKDVLRNWSDEECAKILTNIRKTIGSNQAKLLIAELIPDEKGHDHLANGADLWTMRFGGKERSLVEFEYLFQKTGWKTQKIISTDSILRILEGVPI